RRNDEASIGRSADAHPADVLLVDPGVLLDPFALPLRSPRWRYRSRPFGVRIASPRHRTGRHGDTAASVCLLSARRVRSAPTRLWGTSALTDHSRTRRSSTAALSLLALGVVFGDIGTSPLYALKETFNPQYGISLVPENIVGGCSAIFWALMIVVSLKYVSLIMRAHNNGEGGILALLALASSAVRSRPRLTLPIMLLGLIGVSLFYGDAVLTPA